MDLINSSVLAFHGVVRWLVVAAGGVAVGCLIASIPGDWAMQKLAKRATGALGIVLGAQSLLGVALFALMMAQNDAPFGGRGATQAGHSLGGVLMTGCAAISLFLQHRHLNPRFRSAIALAPVIVAAMLLGKFFVSAPAALVSLLLSALVLRRKHLHA